MFPSSLLCHGLATGKLSQSRYDSASSRKLVKYRKIAMLVPPNFVVSYGSGSAKAKWFRRSPGPPRRNLNGMQFRGRKAYNAPSQISALPSRREHKVLGWWMIGLLAAAVAATPTRSQPCRERQTRRQT